MTTESIQPNSKHNSVESEGKTMLELAVEHREIHALKRLLEWPEYLSQLQARRNDADEVIVQARLWLDANGRNGGDESSEPGAPLYHLLARRRRDWVDWRWVFWREQRMLRQNAT